MIDLSVQHRFEGFDLDVAFQAPPGVTAVFGRSGAGKTTLVNAVAGLLRPDAGRVSIDGSLLFDRGVWVPPHRRRVGYVFQDARLFPHMTVVQNLRYGGANDEARVIDMLGVGALLDRSPAELSGGEKQRVAIGRALMSDPAILLMDEPLAALDQPRKDEIMPYLARLRDEVGIPILYVSHALSEIAQLATTLVLIEEGRCVAVGPVDQILADPELVSHVGIRSAGAVLSGIVTSLGADGLMDVAVPGGNLFLPIDGKEVGARLRVRIEAQDVILSRDRPVGLSALNILSGTISALKDGTGPGVMVQVNLGDASILARVTTRSAKALELTIGQPIHAVVKTVSVAHGDIGSTGNGRLLRRDTT